MVYNGTLYGTTDGNENQSLFGTVFTISTSGKEHVIHTFGKGGDGIGPLGRLVAVNGTLYGTTSLGGDYGVGTVFSISPTGKEEHVIHSFASYSDGSYPYAGLLVFNGMLYGTTVGNATTLPGTVFELMLP
jgi:uncharacterized repeat protein (TIGR03803 family)